MIHALTNHTIVYGNLNYQYYVPTEEHACFMSLRVDSHDLMGKEYTGVYFDTIKKG